MFVKHLQIYVRFITSALYTLQKSIPYITLPAIKRSYYFDFYDQYSLILLKWEFYLIYKYDCFAFYQNPVYICPLNQTPINTWFIFF